MSFIIATWPPSIQMGVTAGIFLASILPKEMRYLVYIRYLCTVHMYRCICEYIMTAGKHAGHIQQIFFQHRRLALSSRFAAKS